MYAYYYLERQVKTTSEQARIKDQEDAVKAEVVAGGHAARRENKETLLLKKK